jgi:hypothetical protein
LKNMKISRLAFLTSAAWLACAAARAQSVVPNLIGSVPPNESPAITPIGRQIGAQGLLYRFSISGIIMPMMPPALNLSGAQAFVQIGAAAPLACTATASPASNQCGFVEGGNVPAQDYAVRIVYNGLFPDGTVIQYWVTGVRTAATSNPASVAQDPLSATHISFLTKSVTRTPVSAAMVLDISGSMASNIVGGTGTRLAALQSSSEVFLNLLKSLPADPSDRTGAVFFSTSASVPPPMIAANDAVAVDGLISSIDAKVANGSTSIGDGLLKARDLIKNTSPTTNARSILLFSDGEQNTAPNTDGTLNISGAAAAADNGLFEPSITKVCPVTLGNQTTPGFTLMQNIGNSRCSGRSAHVTDTAAGTPELTLFFAQALENAFVGDKLETSKMLSGTLNPTAGPTQTETFTVNSGDQFLKIVLSWDTGRIESLPFQLQAPDGTLVDPRLFTVVGQNRNSVTSIAFPIVVSNKNVQKAGDWKIVIGGAAGPQIGIVAQVQYSGLILLDNAILDSNFEAINPDPGTGEPIRLRATLKEGGRPVTGATVIAQMAGPKQGLGDILATQATPATLPPSADQQTPAQAKLAALEADPATQGLFLPQNLPAVTLFDDGMHDDGAAGDGVYGGSFAGTDLEGFYKFQFGLVANAPKNGQYTRTFTQPVFVRAKADPGMTSITVSRTGLTIVLKAIPKDKFNHFLGPDYIGNLHLTSSAGTVQTPLSDPLDGSYQVSYLIPSAGSNPQITLEVMGTVVKQGPLHSFPGGGAGGGGSGGGAGSLSHFEATFDLGGAFPMGNFGNAANPSISIGGGFDYRFSHMLSAGIYVGHDRFSLKAGGGDSFVTHVSPEVRVTAPLGFVRPFAQAGVGVYVPGPGGSAHFGWNLGGGLDHWLAPHVGVEAVYNFRQVDGNAGTLNYSTVRGGLRFRF